MSDPREWPNLFAKRRQRTEDPDDAEIQAAMATWKQRLDEDDAVAEPRLDAELTELLTRIHDPGA